MVEKFIVRVIRRRITENPSNGTDGGSKLLQNEADQIYEQEFDDLNIGELAVMLNRKDGQGKDEKSLKMGNGLGNDGLGHVLDH